jgi:hypothetical protein
MKPVERVIAKLRGGRIHQFDRVEPGTLPRANGFQPAYLLKWRKKIPALSYPPTVPATTLKRPGEELVLAAERAGEAKVWPTSTLRVHHIINDMLGGEPYLVTFCLKCFSGVAFDPRVDGTVLTFELHGMYEGSATMQDEQTGTVWAHLTGQSMLGPLVGRDLELAPVRMTTLGRWLELYPNSVAPDPGIMVGPRSFRPGQPGLDREFRSTISRLDPRLPRRQYILGVAVDGVARAYPVDPDRPGPRIHQDLLGDVPIALLAPDGAWPVAFDRRAGGRVVDLRLQDDRIVSEDGTAWAADGRAVEGPLAGTSLAFVPSRLVEWYAWVGHYPGTELGRLPGVTPAG